MKLFKYPHSERSEELARFNEVLEKDAFHAGSFGLAFDIWRDDQWLFSSYTPEQSETMDSWADRAYPEITAHEYRSTKMGMGPSVSAIDRYPVPLRSALDRGLSLNTIVSILRAGLATAQAPWGPVYLDLVANDNSLRQRMYNAKDGWIVYKIFDQENRVAIRAVIMKLEKDPVDGPQSQYELEIKRRDSDLEGEMNTQIRKFVAPTVNLADSTARRPVLKQAKEATNTVGKAGPVIEAHERRCVFRFGSYPFDLVLTRLEDLPHDKPAAQPEGFLR